MPIIIRGNHLIGHVRRQQWQGSSRWCSGSGRCQQTPTAAAVSRTIADHRFVALTWSRVVDGRSDWPFLNLGDIHPRTTARGLWPAPPAASISKPTSAVGQTKRAHKHETVRDLVRAREEQLHHTSNKSLHANANCAWPRCVLTLTLSTRSHRASRRTHPGLLAQQTPSRARSTRRQTCF